ncbi:MAG: hypothetical protein WD225_02980 [Ilumatobacteraceae bacterium]
MTRGRTAVTATILVALVGPVISACGETIDLREQEVADDAGEPGASPDTPLPGDGTLDELLPILIERWHGLDQRVIDGDATHPLERIEEVWSLTEPIIRSDHPSTLFGYQQAVELARSAVERRRPADASKGYRLVIELTDDLLAR